MYLLTYLRRANNKVMTSRTEVRDDGTLQFHDVTVEEQGGYECLATNRAGTAVVLAVLNVQGKTT